MEKSTGRTIKLGVFVTLGVIIITVAVYLLGEKQSMFSQTFIIRAVFENVNGLQQGNNVRFSGINVGSVIEVTILNDTLIEVRMRIRESYHPYIKKNAIASVGTDGLMGNKLINISPGKEPSVPVENENLIRSYSSIDTEAVLSTLNMTNENVAVLVKNLVDLTNKIKTGPSTLNEIIYGADLRNDAMATVKNLRLTSEKTYEISRQLSAITRDLKEGHGTLGWLLTDTTSEIKITATLESLEKTGEHLRAVSDSLNVLIARMKEGEGTISVLVNDTAVANDLKQTLNNLNQGSSSLQENLDALRYSWPFKKGFKKMEKEKEKEKMKKE